MSHFAEERLAKYPVYLARVPRMARRGYASRGRGRITGHCPRDRECLDLEERAMSINDDVRDRSRIPRLARRRSGEDSPLAAAATITVEFMAAACCHRVIYRISPRISPLTFYRYAANSHPFFRACARAPPTPSLASNSRNR